MAHSWRAMACGRVKVVVARGVGGWGWSRLRRAREGAVRPCHDVIVCGERGVEGGGRGIPGGSGFKHSHRSPASAPLPCHRLGLSGRACESGVGAPCHRQGRGLAARGVRWGSSHPWEGAAGAWRRDGCSRTNSGGYRGSSNAQKRCHNVDQRAQKQHCFCFLTSIHASGQCAMQTRAYVWECVREVVGECGGVTQGNW